MFYTQSQPGSLFDIDDAKMHLRIDGLEEDTYLAGLIAAATSHAELSMQCSLLNRTITATFYAGETLNLPRGPVVSVSLVTLNGVAVSDSAYSIERYGTSELLRYNNGNTQPHAAPAELTVTYTAGYGDSPTDIPADIIQVIKCHVGLMYEQREVATDRTITPVPFISDFYKLRSREPGVG
jgi:uncharacterized phiE125 gp8 family phage protein